MYYLVSDFFTDTMRRVSNTQTLYFIRNECQISKHKTGAYKIVFVVMLSKYSTHGRQRMVKQEALCVPIHYIDFGENTLFSLILYGDSIILVSLYTHHKSFEHSGEYRSKNLGSPIMFGEKYYGNILSMIGELNFQVLSLYSL